MPTCYHWGAPDGSDCRDVSTDVVYEDLNGHHFCLLHAPKYYVGPKGFFLGEVENYHPKTPRISKEQFDEQLQILIKNQASNPDVRFDNIYFPKNFSNSFDQYKEPDVRFSFYSCHNISSLSNSEFKAIRMNKCDMNGFHIHNVKAEELSITYSNVSRRSEIRDSKIDTMSFHNTVFDCPFRIRKIKEHKNKMYKCSIYFNEMNFLNDVEINAIEYLDENSEFKVVNSTFESNLYYHDNKINDFISFEYCKFNGGKAYLENIDASKINLSAINLEYIRFSNCKFPQNYQYIEEESKSKAEEVYRELKKIAFDQKDYSLVSKWHYLEKEMSRENKKLEKNYLVYTFLFVYRYLSGYGEKPSQAIISLCVYILFVTFFLVIISVFHTGFSYEINWEIGRSLLYSLRDFLPFFITPSKSSLLVFIENNWFSTLLYNLIAAFGRIFCVIQITLLTLSIRNQMKR